MANPRSFGVVIDNPMVWCGVSNPSPVFRFGHSTKWRAGFGRRGFRSIGHTQLKGMGVGFAISHKQGACDLSWVGLCNHSPSLGWQSFPNEELAIFRGVGSAIIEFRKQGACDLSWGWLCNRSQARSLQSFAGGLCNHSQARSLRSFAGKEFDVGDDENMWLRKSV